MSGVSGVRGVSGVCSVRGVRGVRGVSARLLLLCFACAPAFCAAADAVREVHGMADAIAVPGVALAWAVARGSGTGDATVVIRIAVDAPRFPFADATGVDPFTRSRTTVLAGTRIGGGIDVRVPRAHFADFPRTEVRFFGSEAAMQTDAPNLVVFYLGVPDTTPEFATEAALDGYLADRIARLRASPGSKAP